MSNSTKNLAYIISSNGDDPISSLSLDLCKSYANQIFSILSSGRPIKVVDSMPDTLPSENYFSVTTNNPDMSMSIKLFQINEIETGWFRSFKIRKSILIKELHIKPIEVLSPLHVYNDEHLVKNNNLQNVLVQDYEGYKVREDADEEEVQVEVGEDVDEEEVQGEVEFDDEYTKEIENEIILYIKERLFAVECAPCRSEKMKLCIEIFTKLTEKHSKTFINKHKLFEKVCRDKMIHLYNVDKFTEMKDLYFKIFDKEIEQWC